MQNNNSLEQAKFFFLAGLEKLIVNNFTGAENDFQTSLKFGSKNYHPNHIHASIPGSHRDA